MSKKLLLFPTLIYIEPSFLTEIQCKSIESLINSEQLNNSVENSAFFGDASSSYLGYKSKDSLINFLEDNIECLNGLGKKIQSVFDNYCLDSNINKLRPSHSWFNIQNKKSFIKQHTHNISVLSAALYVNANEGGCPLFFENPNPYVQYRNFEYLESSQFSIYSEMSHIQPKSGMLVVFPSWIKHGAFYMENNMNNRIVISINTENCEEKIEKNISNINYN